MIPYHYTSKDLESNSALSMWTFEAFDNCDTWVLPDGCRDLIVKQRDADHQQWFVSELDRSAYSVPASAGMRFTGIRLQPGIRIRQEELSAWIEGRNPSELFGTDQVEEFCVAIEGLTTALQCLAFGKRTVQEVAKDLGVSLRTLERFIKVNTGESPYFWFALARARKAARLLPLYPTLSEVAIDTGFSDQSHMNREMKKWFGLTPNQIKHSTEILNLLAESGYA